MSAVVPFVESMQAAAASQWLPATGPAWLGASRREALQAFVALGLPSTRNELWKYTSLRALAQRQYAAADSTAANRVVDAGLLRLPGVDGPRAVFVNGAFRADLSSLSTLPEGVSLQPLSQALRDHPEPLRFLLSGQDGREDDDGFTLLNRALATEGMVLRVAAGVALREPLHVVHVGVPAEEAGVAWHLRSVVELGEGARLDVVEHHTGRGDAGHLANLVRNITLHKDAQLHWTSVQDASETATLFRCSRFQLHSGAQASLHALELGGKLNRHEIRVDLAGTGARFDSRGAFVLDGRQHADTEVLVTHRGRDTVSDALWRGVADGRARGVVHGRILVLPGADGADGGFYNKNLLLSQGAEIDTRPALEIYADEVKANHGATVGQLDENVLFYLRTRGIPLALARRMLVRAFCAVTLDGIEPRGLRDHCEALLAEQLPEVAP